MTRRLALLFVTFGGVGYAPFAPGTAASLLGCVLLYLFPGMLNHPAFVILLIASANAIWPSYGTAFLDLAVSIYPGYHRGQAIGQVLTGTLYALVDGAIWGGAFAFLYNLLARRFSSGEE